MGYDKHIHKGVDKYPLSTSWRRIPRDEQGDVPCTFCSKYIKEGEPLWTYHYQNEAKVRCEVCITKLRAGKEVKDGYDYTIIDLFKYRKAAELNMKLTLGDEYRKMTSKFLKDPHHTILGYIDRKYLFIKRDAYQIAECYKPFLPKISMTMIFRLGNMYKASVGEKRSKRNSNRPFDNLGRLYVFEEKYYREYFQEVMKKKMQGFVNVEEADNYVYGSLMKADLKLSDDGLTIRINI